MGNGTLEADVVTFPGSIFAPGPANVGQDSPAQGSSIFDIDGNLELGGTLVLEIGGTFDDVPAGLADFDRLEVTGQVSLRDGAVVDASLTDNFVPLLGDFSTSWQVTR